MSCATCGRPLPVNAWSLTVCSASCVDAYVDALPVDATAPATPAVTGPLDAWLQQDAHAHRGVGVAEA